MYLFGLGLRVIDISIEAGAGAPTQNRVYLGDGTVTIKFTVIIYNLVPLYL